MTPSTPTTTSNKRDVRYLGFAHRHSNCVIPKPAVSFLGMALVVGSQLSIDDEDKAPELPLPCVECGCPASDDYMRQVCDTCGVNGINHKGPWPCGICRKDTKSYNPFTFDKKSIKVCPDCLSKLPASVRVSGSLFWCVACFQQPACGKNVWCYDCLNEGKAPSLTNEAKFSSWDDVKPGDYVKVKLCRFEERRGFRRSGKLYAIKRQGIVVANGVANGSGSSGSVCIWLDKPVRYGKHEGAPSYSLEGKLWDLLDYPKQPRMLYGDVDGPDAIKLVKVIRAAK